ncbi:MAG TPA: TIGR03560 family F420-dependent LLM class oxidoreductase [Gaiellaceae bacterium]|nr:TIGR03560 family F420-dependent LLM class oxidoreductase [Gaiellaceae bacterium]
MRACLMIEGQEDVTWEDWLALAQACEEHGLEGLFRSDHYASVMDDYSRGSLDAWATIAALGARTERIRLGSLVSPATFRHPSELAKAVVTADHVSGGRVELGLGAGWHETEHAMFGFPFPERRVRLERFAEQLEIVHRQWTEETFDFAGLHYRLEGCRALPKPVQRPHPPLIVGGRAMRGTVEPAVRWADEYNTIFASPATVRERRAALDEGCERAGRDPATLPLSLMTICIVGADEGEVRGRAGRVAAIRGEAGGGEAFLASQRETGIVGTVEQVRERLAELEAAGVERVFLEHLDHRDLAMVELVGRELL